MRHAYFIHARNVISIPRARVAILQVLIAALAPVTVLSPTTVGAQAAVKRMLAAERAPSEEDWKAGSCKLNVTAMRNDSLVWFRSGAMWQQGRPSGNRIASLSSSARDQSSAETVLDGTVLVILPGEKRFPLGGNARHVDTSGNVARTFYARPVIINWWPDYQPDFFTGSPTPTHTSVFVWASDGYLHYRTAHNRDRSFSNWVKLTQTRVFSDPAVVLRRLQPHLEIFAQGPKNTLVHWTATGTGWEFETVPIARPSSAPSVMVDEAASTIEVKSPALYTGRWSCEGKFNRKNKPGVFHDAFSDGCWSCPADYERSGFPRIGHYDKANSKWVGETNSCVKGGFLGIGAEWAHATHHGPRGCEAGSFRNGLYDHCYVCPGRGQRQTPIGYDLTQMNDACIQYVRSVFSVVYRNAAGRIESIRWDLNYKDDFKRDVRRGWFLDTLDIPKAFAAVSSAPVLVGDAPEGRFLVARDTTGEYRFVRLFGGRSSAIFRLGAPPCELGVSCDDAKPLGAPSKANLPYAEFTAVIRCP